MSQAPQAHPSHDSRMPGVGAAAAVLGFVEAGLGLGVTAYVLVLLASFGAAGSDEGAALAFLAVTIVLSALLALGGLFLVRGTGRRLLIGATVAELVAGLALGVWGLLDSTSANDLGYVGYGYPPGPGPAVGVALLTLIMAGLSLPVIRLALVTQPTVGAWLRGRPPATPVWSAEAQQWTAPVQRGRGTVLAVLAPVVLLVAATVVVLTTTAEPVDFGAPGAEYGADSPYSGLYDDGEPVEPPSSDDPDYDAQYDRDAQDCYDGDMRACDDLYDGTPVGSLYEWLGGTCGGREATIIEYSCA